MTTPPRQERWDAAHTIADRAGNDGYFDPDSGLFVMTQGYLERRRKCCSSRCRHCPYK
ncbi:MAG: DUF5522 domain-containing protein [Acidimicrobiales bacterium]